jgi:hypothetical protein
VLPLLLAGCASFSLFFLFVAPTGGWAILEHGMSLSRSKFCVLNQLWL